MSSAGILYLVSTPIGNLGDLTHRAVEVLRACDIILAEDTRRTRVLLEHYAVAFRDLRSFHKHNEAARCEEVCAALAAGRSVALVSDSGTPLISDPGLRLVRAAQAATERVVPIPGASAALAALVACGLDPQPFTFFGFLPRSGPKRRELVAELRELRHTAVLFEAPQRLARTLVEFAGELGENRTAVVARELTKLHEEFRSGTLGELAAYYQEHVPKGEVVLCLEAASAIPAGLPEADALVVARRMTQEGASSKEIVRVLREECGLERNRAYAIALQAAEGKLA
ncbi:MAG: 16S rRNA (cytidine(1402)-2'-O)-methyltransferase [Gemmatimonadota bacterium]|nr:MAG: 16S rRNA (cytidine(1402)-2'-O)-methyltransferase [Gemmatimonadota bacterium]